jgi:hypothetical protein
VGSIPTLAIALSLQIALKLNLSKALVWATAGRSSPKRRPIMRFLAALETGSAVRLRRDLASQARVTSLQVV